MQSIMPLMMLLQGGGMNPNDQSAMNSMLPMMLMMMDDTEVTDDGEVVSVHVRPHVCRSNRLMLVK